MHELPCAAGCQFSRRCGESTVNNISKKHCIPEIKKVIPNASSFNKLSDTHTNVYNKYTYPIAIIREGKYEVTNRTNSLS